MTTVNRISVFYEVNDAQAKQAFNSLAQASATTNEKMIQNVEKFEESVKRQAQTVKASASNMRSSVGNIAAQFNDIGVTAASGMSPLLIVLQQGTQLSQAFAGQGLGGVVKGLGAAFGSLVSPVSLVTLGLTAVSAVAIQAAMSLFSTGESAESVSDKIDDLEAALADYQAAADNADMSTTELAAKYGIAAGRAQELLEVISTMSRIEAASRLREGIDAIADSFDGLILRVEQYNSQTGTDLANSTGLDIAKRRLESLTEEYGLTIAQAQELAGLLQNQQSASSLDEQAEAVRNIATWLADAAEQGNYQNEALNAVAESAARAAVSAYELDETTRSTAQSADDLSYAVGGISFANAISGASTLGAQIGGMIGQAQTLLSVLGQAKMANVDAAERRDLLTLEKNLIEAGRTRVEVEGELAAARKGQELDAAGVWLPPAARSGLIDEARAIASETQAATEAIQKLNAAATKSARGSSGGGGSRRKSGGGGGGGGRPARQEKPFFEDLERDLVQLERQIQLIDKSTEEAATLKATWELLDEAKKRGIPVNDTLNAQINAQAAEVGRLTAELEQGEIAQKDFESAIGTVADTITDVVFAGESLRDSLANIFKGIAADILNSGIRQALSQAFSGQSGGGLFGGLLGGLFGGFRANGGSVSSGRAYVVGENGPELMVPRVSGTVLNSAQVHRAVGSNGGSQSISMTIDLRGTTGDRELDAKIARAGREILAQVPSVMDDVNKRTR